MMVIHLDDSGAIGVTLQAKERPDPGVAVYNVEVQSWGFSAAPRRPPMILVRARSTREAVRRAAGAVLLTYDGDTRPYG
jgi:hypothetical protein